MFKAPGAAATGYLLTMGEPIRVEWYAEGRTATRAEVEHSIDTGLPLLMEGCDQEASPARRSEARSALLQARKNIGELLPA